MVSIISFNSNTWLLRSSLLKPTSALISPSVRFSGELRCRRTRGLSVVTRGVPGPSTYIFAFLFPFSLLAGTIFTSIRIADKLDEDFLQELAVNQAIMEASEDDDDEDDEDDDDASINEVPARPRTRNRPKREAEVSSKQIM